MRKRPISESQAAEAEMVEQNDHSAGEPTAKKFSSSWNLTENSLSHGIKNLLKDTETDQYIKYKEANAFKTLRNDMKQPLQRKAENICMPTIKHSFSDVALDLRTHLRKNIIVKKTENRKEETNRLQEEKQTTDCFANSPTFDKQLPKKKDKSLGILPSAVSYQSNKQPFISSNYFNQCSGLDILSTVATQKLKIKNDFNGFKNEADTKPITSETLDASKSLFQPNKNSTTSDCLAENPAKAFSKPIMDERRVQQLENKVKNINCFDYSKGMFVIPLKIPGHGYKKVKVKRVGTSYLVLFPGESAPRFCNLNAVSKPEVASKNNVPSQQSCLKNLFKQKPSEKSSLMKEILLKRNKPVSVLN